ncbi:uncharacterized protein EI90DRAFT_712873 [Cantharellus anzutake]|uniref:uncharacterized protein n=1 Tax=Cantharellus anzutake TaxID=1750568 RepID=UPI0019043415|nr:uncharacterized protein EI90DRAFT_712873 [Cantharellus anzutake]KAF8332834.1 hypothetical protein EI90DRAFT_712873 [Cantharellus anzutake]
MSAPFIENPCSDDWRTLKWGLFSGDINCFIAEKSERSRRRQTLNEEKRRSEWRHQVAYSQRGMMGNWITGWLKSFGLSESQIEKLPMMNIRLLEIAVETLFRIYDLLQDRQSLGAGDYMPIWHEACDELQRYEGQRRPQLLPLSNPRRFLGSKCLPRGRVAHVRA